MSGAFADPTSAAPAHWDAAARARCVSVAAFVAFPVIGFLLSFAMPANLATFVAMAGTAGLALLLRPAPPLAGPAIPAIVAIMLAGYVISLCYHGGSARTVSSTLAVLYMAVATYIVSRRLVPPGDGATLGWLGALRSSLLLFLIVAVPISVLAAQLSAGIANPAAAILSLGEAGRLRLLARITDGHSLLIPAAFLLIIAELRLPRGWRGGAIISGCIGLLVLSGTRVAAAYLGVALLFCVFRMLRIPSFIQRALFLGLLGSAAVIVWAGHVDGLRSLLEPVQSALPALRLINPATALGSGRDALNEALWALAGRAPLFGVGYDDPTIVFGSAYTAGPGAATAPNESFLRVLATRGWVVALPLMVLFTFPLLAPRRSDPALFAISAGLSLDILLNGNVERLSAPSSVWLWLVGMTMALLPGARRKLPTPANLIADRLDAGPDRARWGRRGASHVW